MRIAFIFLLLALTFATTPSAAGVMELSTSYGLRNSRIDDDNYTKSTSWTGSFAWYFFDLSAIELSYTSGVTEQSLKATNEERLRYVQEFQMYGADLVLTFAGRDSFLQPFIRGGAARLKKKLFRIESDGTQTLFGEPIENTVPSYGAGIKINLTKSFSLKGSYDRWRSGSNNDKEIWDDAIKAGISWYF